MEGHKEIMDMGIPLKCKNCDDVDIYVDEGDNAFDTELRKNTGVKIEVYCKLKECKEEEQNDM
jgi:hypothetical protein